MQKLYTRLCVCTLIFAGACSSSSSPNANNAPGSGQGDPTNPASPGGPSDPAAPVASPSAPACVTAVDLPAPTGHTVTLSAGSDLQAAIDGAQPGDEIVLPAGATFSGSFVLRNKPGASYITIRSSAVSALPAGQRVGPAQASQLARITGTTMNLAPLSTDAGAHHYRLVGLELAATPGQYAYAVVALGTGQETSASQLPHDIIIDRSWVHGDPQAGVMAGVIMNSAATTVANSSITDVKGSDRETQGLSCTNGSGPFTILNNLIQAAGENVMFGGGDAQIPNLVPSDIVIRYNDLEKLLSWKPGDPSFAGTHWVVKNLLELKNARRVTIDGNSFQHSWADAQSGEAALFTVRNQNGGAPWSSVDNVTFTNNLVRHVGGGISILGHDNNNPSQLGHDFTITNNLFFDVGGTVWGGWGRLATIDSGTTDSGPTNVKIDHNTSLQAGDLVASATPGSFVAHPGFVFTNNLVDNGPGGIWGDSELQGDPTLAAYFPGALLTGNALIGGPVASYLAHPMNQFPPTVQLVDPANGDYRLAAASPLIGSAAGKSDPGVDPGPLDLAAQCRR
jgi:hypothetical protein